MVYVDAPKYKYGRMIMCHMIADSLEELHDMAHKIGIDSKWFQDCGKIPHYDICKQKRKLAIKFGAKEVSTRELITIKKKINIFQ